jgi:uncharacterized membrane protein
MPKHVVYSLMATGLWGFWAVFAKLAADRIGHAASALVFSAASFLTVLAVCIISGESLRTSGFSGTAMAVLAGVSGGLAVVSFQKAMSSGPLGVSVSITALYPAVPVIFGLLFLAEHLSPVRLTGVVLAVAAGVLLSI